MLFFDIIITTLTCYFGVHRAGSQLKNKKFKKTGFSFQSGPNPMSFFLTSSSSSSPYPVILEFIELVPSKKLKMYFYSLHYLKAALKSKLSMNLFQSHWLGCWGTTPITSVVVESMPENSFLSKTSNVQCVTPLSHIGTPREVVLGHDRWGDTAMQVTHTL